LFSYPEKASFFGTASDCGQPAFAYPWLRRDMGYGGQAGTRKPVTSKPPYRQSFLHELLFIGVEHQKGMLGVIMVCRG